MIFRSSLQTIAEVMHKGMDRNLRSLQMAYEQGVDILKQSNLLSGSQERASLFCPKGLRELYCKCKNFDQAL